MHEPPATFRAARRTDYLPAVRLAAQFARETASDGFTVHEIAEDALAIVAHASAARRALEAGRDPAPHIAAARVVAEKYYAKVVDSCDLAGMVLGLRFPSGTFNSGARNVFFVT